jgi:hypothetical protein
MDEKPDSGLETDPRFPSGPWVGFFIQKYPPLGRQTMELRLTFRAGVLHGEGRDLLGPFVLNGRYDLGDGHCRWTKHYLGRHDVFYSGFNEGKGIWGGWQIPAADFRPELRGGFYIWPEGMSDPTGSELVTAIDLDQAIEADEPVPLTV